ncbi:hypothetical protein EDB81DRAFT_869123 [Dactylonectria macrodidyma]|uniref:NACHT domain-containing protein n=1 Tax=Dactylonectria macrodidyma TaxID=307937 RepID=A0A9P9ESN8_9HYPO|nr:hypothetical protein EDB81DRAFT_869123 [Dactylonectria macrodidyma]
MMEGSTDGNPSRASDHPPDEYPPQNLSFAAHSSGSQYNAPNGTLNSSAGSGPQFPGARFSGSVYFNTNEHFDPLQECLKSLAFREMDSRFYDIDTAARGTCEWLPRHEMYTSWATCDRGLLWIKGNPGSGKSTLLRYILDHVMVMSNREEGALILSFFFHGRGSKLQRTPLGLFQSLLHQLLRQVPEALTDLMTTFQQRCETVGKPSEKWQWHPRELPQIFKSSLLKVLRIRPIWLFVDALDECGKENAVDLLEHFESMLQAPPSSDLHRFRICFTCRHYPILNLDSVFEVCVEKENWKDISTFVRDKLSSFRVRMSSTIPDLIITRADGVFLWAWLMVKQVLDLEREGIGLKKMEARIGSVPQKLDDLYCELIRNMGPDSLKLIQWICFAMRPLSLEEMRWAMLVEANCRYRSLDECQAAGDYPSDHDGMKRRVQTLSCGLAEVTPSSHAQVVQFIHQSVKDFFIGKGLSALDKTANPDFVVGTAQHRLSRTCIRYLAMKEIGGLVRREIWGRWESEFPFLDYATTKWVAHTKQSDARSVVQEDLLEYFVGPSNNLIKRWVCVYGILAPFASDRPSEGTSLLQVMSMYGVVGALRAILERADQGGMDINAKDSYGRTPLLSATENGHMAIVRLLLDRGAYIEAMDQQRQTPLLSATENGHEAIVRLLLDRGACIEAMDQQRRTPLLLAVETGNAALVRYLFDQGAYIEAKDQDSRTPLLLAIRNKTEAMIPHFLTRRLYRCKEDWDSQLPLFNAAKKRRLAVIQYLLNQGANVEAKDVWGQTPLSVATANRDEATVKQLLNQGAFYCGKPL